MAQMLFPQIQQASGPNFRKVGKSLNLVLNAFTFTKTWDVLKAEACGLTI